MPVKICKICRKRFYVRPSHLKRGWGSYCSSKCQYKGYKNGIFIDCATCGKKVYRTPHELRRSVSKKHFCDKSCFAVWKNKHILVGKNHPGWKNGEGSYREIMLRSKIPAACSKCGIDDIRVLLTHHLDENRKNNEIKNLEWLCRNCHYLIHNRKTI